MRTAILVLMLASVAIAGCGVRAKSDLRGAQLQAGHTRPVCLLAGSLSTDFSFAELGIVKATKRTYGAVEELDIAMANEARRIGADAIVNYHAGQRFKGPIPWRLTSPTGMGTAIKLTPESKPLDCAALRGRSS